MPLIERCVINFGEGLRTWRVTVVFENNNNKLCGDLLRRWVIDDGISELRLG